MKKTTYILLGTVVVATVVSFLLPVILFTARKSESILLARTGKNVERSMSSFESIEVYPLDYGLLKIAGDESKLRLTIMESDNVTTPRVTMDSSWEGNVNLSYTDDSLYVHVNMESALEKVKDKGGANSHYVLIDENNIDVATITVPRGMLKNLQGADFSMLLKDFVNADLHIVSSWGGVNAVNSSFRYIDIN